MRTKRVRRRAPAIRTRETIARIGPVGFCENLRFSQLEERERTSTG